jgi:hypothetical protein
MPTDVKPVKLTLQINPGADYNAEELDRLTRQLLTEIQDLDVESVELVKGGEPLAGAKSGELVTLGSLAVVVLPVLAPKLIELLQSWSTRAENRIVKIKAQVADRSIDVEYSPSAMSLDDLKRLVSTLSEALPPAAKS